MLIRARESFKRLKLAPPVKYAPTNAPIHNKIPPISVQLGLQSRLLSPKSSSSCFKLVATLARFEASKSAVPSQALSIIVFLSETFAIFIVITINRNIAAIVKVRIVAICEPFLIIVFIALFQTKGT